MAIQACLRNRHSLKEKSPVPKVGDDLPGERSRFAERGGDACCMTRIHAIHNGLGLAQPGIQICRRHLLISFFSDFEILYALQVIVGITKQ